jgi:hypothetical protein
MSKAQEYAAERQYILDAKNDAELRIKASDAERPTFEALSNQGHGFAPRKYRVTDKGSLAVRCPNCSEFCMSPVEARKLATWILDTFTE